ncbi:hypothetical protein STH2579 [Symbiobacterium thermophilum IAM 14863]|uniref:Uncharacterized protein n=1 Tax=Symbiobacterium thermophilum (strain DSM 24528 / JCM 14929 / IAM 14863 / T) TaxID=292459 RepID=Q67L82_SYMTH|nr:hypothetical protein STH2579 [Symbiobacterium thermophilum IAM 14863]
MLAKRSLSSVGRARALHAWGRGFESLSDHQQPQGFTGSGSLAGACALTRLVGRVPRCGADPMAAWKKASTFRAASSHSLSSACADRFAVIVTVERPRAFCVTVSETPSRPGVGTAAEGCGMALIVTLPVPLRVRCRCFPPALVPSRGPSQPTLRPELRCLVP